MPETWYVAHEGRTYGPLTLDALIERVRRGDTPTSALIWSPGDGRWMPVDECPVVGTALALHWRRWYGKPGATPLTVLPPPLGEPWFFAIAPWTVGVLDVVTLGVYSLVWRYQHRVWALRRAGLPTSPIGLVYRYDFSLDLELLRAAETTGVRPPFHISLPKGTAAETFATAAVAFMLLCCSPLLLVLGTLVRAHTDMMLQRTARLVNRAVAPARREPVLGWPEVAVLLVTGWAAITLAVILKFG